MAFITTLILLASVAYLAWELIKRTLDRGDGDAVAQLVGIPFINRPDLARADRQFEIDLDFVRCLY